MEEESWKGKWFPVPPGQSLPETPATQNVEDNNLTDMGNSDQICDDGVVIEEFAMTKMKFIKNSLVSVFRASCNWTTIRVT